MSLVDYELGHMFKKFFSSLLRDTYKDMNKKLRYWYILFYSLWSGNFSVSRYLPHTKERDVTVVLAFVYSNLHLCIYET